MFHLEIITKWLDEFLRTYLLDGWALFIEFVLIGVAILAAYAVLALILIWLERKVCAFFQCRLGPNRVGPFGLLQSVADMIKILLKELIKINKVDPFLFRTAMFLVIIASICTFGALPFDKGIQAVDFNIGVFYLLAVSSLGVVGILIAGWSSNNKYTLIGAMRSGAQLISYELSCGLALMTIVMLSGSLQLSEIVAQQSYAWNIFRGGIPAIIALIIYLIAGHAETNRGPFDLPEAESELTAGYHTEYSGIQFGFFYLAEYLNMFIIAAIASTLFLGGWMPFHIPGWAGFNAVMDLIPPVIWFFGKTFACIFLALWVRWTMPRLRIDQLLNLEWKILMPLSLINIILMALWIIYV
ncbi:MAG: NADH-quinone oxidoreductase subunit NuoH [Candidatus Symbiothrix sp.]|jgi:NADH-quinone oxidoreductase subunit H|nr:NADH-quinone oxidoreductase subunit NuoH [Candidatus Symbiothrix sp.]